LGDIISMGRETRSMKKSFFDERKGEDLDSNIVRGEKAGGLGQLSLYKG